MCYLIQSCVAGITVPPESVNVGLNKTVSFTCTAIAETIRWQVIMNEQPSLLALISGAEGLMTALHL